MGDKDTDKLFGNPELLILGPDGEMRSLGKVVEGSTNIESEEESDFVPTKGSFSVSCEVPGLSDNFAQIEYLKPVQEAQGMLTRLSEYHVMWHKYYGMGMRKERRKIERNFNALAQRFALHCKIYNITIRPNKVKNNE